MDYLSEKNMSSVCEKNNLENMDYFDQVGLERHFDEHPGKRRRIQIFLNIKVDTMPDTLSTLTFTEPIDEKLLTRLINSGLLKSSFNGNDHERRYQCVEVKHMSKLLQRIKVGVLKVTYKKPKCCGYGRVTPANSMSLGSLRKAVRHTLCGDDWWDFDVKNCHPTILYQLCKYNGIVCFALGKYVTERDSCLAEVVDALFVEGADPEEMHDAAKTLFLVIMYGGGFKKWCTDHADKLLVAKPEVPNIVSDLEYEVRAISKHMQNANPPMVRAVKAHKARKAHRNKKVADDYNFDGSFLSYYVQEWERRVLEAIWGMMRTKGYIDDETNDCVLCHDGIMVRRENCMGTSVEDIIIECEREIKEKLGLDLRFDTKPMTKSLLPEIEAAEQAEGAFSFPHDKLMELDTGYMNELGSYPLKKRYFEHFIVKAMRPDPIFVWTNRRKEMDEYGVEFTKYVSVNYDEARLTKALRHVRGGNTNTSRYGNEKSFTDLWFSDPNIRVYNRVDFMPYNGVFNPAQHDKRCFNLFQGYNPHIQAPLENESAALRNRYLTPFFDLGLELFGGNRQFLDFFLKCIAKVIQIPQQKHPYCFILTGKQGTGKTLFCDAIGRIVDHTHYYSTTNPDDLFGTHAEGFVHKTIVVMNECEGKDTMFIEGKMKGAISDVWMTVNAKNRRPVRMRNLAFIIICSNKPNPVQIDVKSADRRFLCAKGTEKYLGKRSGFWKQLAHHFMRPEFIRCLYDYLNNIDISNVDWDAERKQNLTKDYRDLAALYVPNEALFFEEMAQAIKNGRKWPYMPRPYPEAQPEMWGVCTKYKKHDLYRKQKEWAMEKGYCKDSAPTPKQFYNKLQATLNLPIINCGKYNGVDRYELDPGVVHRHLVKNRWVETDGGCEDGGRSVEAFCKDFVNELVGRVCDEVDQAAYFNMDMDVE